jgi:D-serine deaminase-like pyridoxal phosphate-dependent protein
MTTRITDLPTPAFLVDQAVVEKNCRAMRQKAIDSEVVFRPHVKTHKTIEIAKMQHGGIGPITVSTLAEAEFFADAGFGDITYAVPIAPAKLARAARLAGRVDCLNILVDDSPGILEAREEHAGRDGAILDVFIKVDCGYHRAGLDPARKESVEFVLRLATSKGVRVRGLLTHAGHSYDARSRDEVLAIAAAEAGALETFSSRLQGAGLPPLLRSIGSTPTASLVDRFTNCDEVRPGNYVFFDAFQATLGSCRREDVAVSVLATVIGSYADRIIIDAGALALSKDAGPNHLDPEFGYGIVCDVDLQLLPLRLVSLSQEHGKLLAARDHALPALPVGTRVRVLPNHSCLTAALFDRYHVLENGEVASEWSPVRGW